jgi:hypothetical protein
VATVHTSIMWPGDPPEKRATERPLTWSRALIAGGIFILGGLGSYLMTAVNLVRRRDGLFLALVLGAFGLVFLGYSLYRLIMFGRFDSGYDASVDGPLEMKLKDEEDSSP